MKPSLIYVADTMCSWCWGFQPALTALCQAHPELPVRIINGGLRPGSAAQTLDASLRGYLTQAWRSVEAASGQPFDWTVLDWTDFRYDTDPAARAVVAVRRLEPTRELDYFRALQAAFYAQGRDITRVTVQVEVAEACGLDATQMDAALGAPDLGLVTRSDYLEARSLGVQGFPTLLLDRGEDLRGICAGFKTSDGLLSAFEAVLEHA